MSLPDIALPLPDAGDPPDSAFAASFARALRALHLSGGGVPAQAGAIEMLARRSALAVQDGQVFIELADDDDTDRSRLLASPVIADGTQADPFAPLVLVGSRLYLYRYWRYQHQLAQGLRALNRPRPGIDADAVSRALAQVFNTPAATSPDWQKIAAASAIARSLCVISGGPGTGKTTTVLRLLAALLLLEPELRIAIAAPTGKAAARLQDSIRAQAAALDLPAAARARLPAEGHTLHRLLGIRPDRASPRHHAGNPLPYQVVVVDEASMLDLALAARLLAALPADARLILLGDKDQLAAVEAGAIFAELSATRAIDAAWSQRLHPLSGEGVPATPADGHADAVLPNAVTWLHHSYRFGAGSGIGRLAQAINRGDAVAAHALLHADRSDLRGHDQLPEPRLLAPQLAAGFDHYVDAVRAGVPPAAVLRALERYRVLCASRSGRYGSLELAALLDQELARRLDEPARGARWFAGRAVMVTANDYALRLYNGDIGVALADADGTLRVHFSAPDGATRPIAPIRLGAVESALALTVHKSQGSEFERIDLVVDPSVARGLSRELLYTGLTRARLAASLWCAPDLLESAIAQRLERQPVLIASGATPSL